MEKPQSMFNKTLNGFSIIEVVVAVTIFSILSSSIYLMISYVLSSTNIIAHDYLSEISYRSYLEKLKLNPEIANKDFEEKLITFNGELHFRVNSKSSPNPNITLTTLVTIHPLKNASYQIYWRQND